ncbi:neuraminidase-like domain-containing protein [Nitrosospira sp. Is2]|uniref:neuraminidase-like domain-containing protein n=1 Tax=Nitrosospira sp. Is2 TaxID=3080532 RepID=UPI00295456B4|nr:neuraminidase-like domain-containing protein [Nitrosospira sp. Is2]WON73553.1 neuraminidase-like domain-containing protein [Nitrosospira sp. Is2]
MTVSSRIYAKGTLERNRDTWLLVTQEGTILVEVTLPDLSLDQKAVSIIGTIGISSGTPGTVRLIVEKLASHDEITKKAYEIYMSGQGGTSEENWSRAEQELLGGPISTVSPLIATPEKHELIDKLTVGNVGDEVSRLHEDLQKQAFVVPPEEVKQKVFGPGTLEAVRKFQLANSIGIGQAISKTAAAAQSTAGAVPLAQAAQAVADVQGKIAPAVQASTGQRVVKGRVALTYGVPAEKLKLRLYQRGFGGTQTLLKEVETDEDGKYEIPYANEAANFEVHAVGSDGKEIQLSQTKFNSATEENLDLIAPGKLQPPQPEFARLKTALSARLQQPEILKNAIERGGRRDISDLAATTNWDGRALVLASLAYQHADTTKMPADALYALYRAGLPATPKTLAKISRHTVETALNQAVQAGIIDGSAVEAGVKAFKALAETEFLNFIPPGKLSNLSEFVARASVSPEDRTAFTNILKEGNGENLWSRAKQAGVSEQGITTLQLQGKLAYLTLNNAELTTWLLEKIGSGDVLKLIELDFDQAATWVREISALANGYDARIGSLVPPAFTGLNNQARLQAYSEELARRVRQMDGNRVTMRQLERGDLDGISSEAKAGVQAFLGSAASKGFRLGQTAISSFIKEHGEENLLPDKTPAEKKAALDEVKSVHRLYSLSPSDKALNVLRKKGFTSAYDITALPYRDFVNLVGPEIGATGEIPLIYWKAQQQSATVFNVFAGAKRLDVAPPMDSVSGKKVKRDAQVAKAKEKLTGRYPTLEVLFGSVDYCECEHCKSVLSPAAYLVDILHFIDPKEPQWGSQKMQWKMAQADQQNDYEPAHKKPFDALVARRPDIPNIALTCENTNTPMPYIDIVNEILELLVVGGFGGIKAFDTGTSTSKDLIAEPQNITWEAYVGGAKPGLNTLVYPLSLPFDLPLEMVRAFLTQLDMPLWKLREVIGRPSKLWGTTGNAEGLVDVWFERLGLGPADIGVLTGAYPWYLLYGYTDEATALAELGNAQTLARRLGVTYKELVELFKTEFVNPKLGNLVVLHKLDLDPDEVERYFNPTDQTALSPTEHSALEARVKTLKIKPEDIRSLWNDEVRENVLLLRSPDGGSDFSKTTVAFAKSPANNSSALILAFVKLNAFVRLQKKLGWDLATIDSALRAFVRPNVTALTLDNWGPSMHRALIYLAHLHEIGTRTKNRATLEELLLLWSPVPTTGFSNLYERLFLNNSVLSRDSVFDDPLGRYLQGSSGNVDDHIDVVTQALQISHEDIRQIFVRTGMTNPKLTIENLSILIRHSVLAKALDMSVSNLLSYLALSAHAPMRDLSAAPFQEVKEDIPFSETIAFIKQVETIQEAGLSINVLEEICRQLGQSVQAEALATLADQLLTALSALPKVEPLPQDPTPRVTKKHEEAQQRDRLAILQTLSAQLGTSEALITMLVTGILTDPAAHKPLIESMTTRTESLPNAGTRWIFYVWFTAAGSYKLLTSPDSGPRLRFGVDGDMREIAHQNGNFDLLQIEVGKRYRLELTLSTQGTMSIEGDAIPTGVAVENYERFTAATFRLRKALDLLVTLDISEAELNYVRSLSGAAELKGLPLIPVTDDQTAKAILSTIWTWVDLAAARVYYRAGDRAVNVLQAAKRTFDDPDKQPVFESDLNDALVALTGREVEFVQATRDALGYNITKSTEGNISVYQVIGLSTGDELRRLTNAITGLVRLNLRPADIIQWARKPVDAAVATKIRAALKGRYPPSAWRELVQPIFDQLRKKQRDALVAHLVNLPNSPYGATQEQLLERLLLDPGTEPPVLASRIQLAISSVQLFIQRCLMSLEDEVVPSIIDSKRWQWMCRYRVWEVNRKMYCWAENWLDQEFRDDKTHLFRELEGALLEGDVSDDLVRTALHTYLQGLQNIARLEMMTMYFEPGVSADGATVHVIGRTQHAPHKYFYRQCSHRMWTPWEPLDTEIEGEHLALTIWRGRMHLFWVTFLEKTEQSTGSSDMTFEGMRGTKTGDVKPAVTIQIQLNWVEQVQGKWANRSATKTFENARQFANKRASDPELRRQFSLHVKVDTRETEELGDDILELHLVHNDAKEQKSQKFVMISKLAPPKLVEGGNLSIPGPVSGLTPSASKWVGSSPLSISFISDVTQDNGVPAPNSGAPNKYSILDQGGEFRLLFPSNEIRLDPNSTIPRAAGNTSGYVFAHQDAQHVVYRGTDQNIHDVWGTLNGWFLSTPTAEAEAEPAVSDPHGYPLDEKFMHCIAYCTERKVLELSWSSVDSPGLDEDQNGTTGWQVETLYEATSEADLPVGRPLGGIFTPDRGVVYRVQDGRIFSAVEAAAPASWTNQHLNSGSIPLAASDPVGFVMSEMINDVTTVQSRHIFYRGTDGHVHELKSDPAGVAWTHADITATSGAPVPAPDAQPGAYAFLSQKTLHVVYRDQEGVVHELWGFAGNWNHIAIGVGYGKADGDPTGYAFEGQGSQHVVYRGKDQQIHELWWTLFGWRENILTQAVSKAPEARRNPAGYSFEKQGTQHVVYQEKDGGLRELWWNLEGWHLGTYELMKPLMDPIGPLIAPFFYEDQGAPHTFFVEPSLAEKTVHDWKEYVVTTEEYVQEHPSIKFDFKPYFERQVEVVPSDLGILKKEARHRDVMFENNVLLQTSKGLFNSRGSVRANAMSETKTSTHAMKIINTTAGARMLDNEFVMDKRVFRETFK